ncbi:MAG: HU family DNA-binding protein [Paludibacteraceae bacterium]|nr:HU family DNA-binding protein [Paludibacteraceae bacterium]MBP3717152.1 HU family DNA-binding protein [Paludibacteraceae bacterium]MBR6105047.1 HU family DNA-binding protein [Paludibacteraceae bacterium]
MNTKDLITTIRGQQSLSAEEAELLFDATVKAIKKQLLDGNVVAVQGFGQFEPKKKNERISVNPASGERMLVPPKISVAFKPSSVLKDRFSND